VPGLRVIDVLGSSETGRQAVSTSGAGADDAGAPTRFMPSPTTAVLRADLSGLLPAGSDESGWLAKRGRIPRGYLGDEAKTRATFPVIEGQTWAVAGDKARWRADGSIELLGRESVTINTGGEKVFAEEVEQALKHHPAVYDALVVGRPSEKWGQEVVAVVSLRDGDQIDLADLRAVAGEHLASYKLPKAVVVRPSIVRSPSGKPDYAWAREQVGADTVGPAAHAS
jgi:acyl-CoA synthetase (AMP-forming)/AMP-acid ligase II